MSAGLSSQFWRLLAGMGVRRATDPAIWLAVWCIESGLDPSARNPSGAQGLNQMMPATLRGLGGPAAFAELAGEEQLPWIEKLIAQGERLNGGPFTSSARYYHANFYPATMSRGSSPGTVVVAGDAADKNERAAYASNKVLDANGDGAITLADLDTFVGKPRCTAALERLAEGQRSYRSPARAGVVCGLVGASVVGVGLAAWGLS